MCLAVPGKVLNIDPKTKNGRVDFGGIIKEASFECLPDAKVGEYVLIHVGLAISKVDESEAKRVFEFIKDMDELDELKRPESGKDPEEKHDAQERLARTHEVHR